MLARTPGGAMTCDGRTDQNVPSPGGVHPIETRASWPVFPRTPPAKAKRPGYATSERPRHEAAPARAPRAGRARGESAAQAPVGPGQNRQLSRRSLNGQTAHGPLARRPASWPVLSQRARSMQAAATGTRAAGGPHWEHITPGSEAQGRKEYGGDLSAAGSQGMSHTRRLTRDVFVRITGRSVSGRPRIPE